MKLFLFGKKGSRSGQSFTELSLVLLILALLLAGVVEYGFMLNSYLHVLDGAREGARFSSNSNPFTLNETTQVYEYDNPEQRFYISTAAEVASVMDPVPLRPSSDPTRSDDVVISVYSVTYLHETSTWSLVQYPSQDPNGWSLCTHYKNGYVATYFALRGVPIPLYLRDVNWPSCSPQQTKFSSSSTLLQSRLDPNAPATGMLIVEVYYHYSQVLRLPVFTSFIPDPIPIHTYTIMPLSAAEATPTP
jgi:hypothetical protein